VTSRETKRGRGRQRHARKAMNRHPGQAPPGMSWDNEGASVIWRLRGAGRRRRGRCDPVAEGLDIEQAGAILAPRPGLNGLLCAESIYESVEEKIAGFAEVVRTVIIHDRCS
jgi:hypothetical protein